MRASQRSSKGPKDQVSDKKELSRRVQLASKHHSEYCIGDDSLSNMSSQSEIITANSPSVTSPQLSMMNDSYVRKKGWQDSNGVPWTKSPPKDEFALLSEKIVDRNCARSTYGRPSPELENMGCFLAMDDVELLERGIVNKSGGRMSKQINAIDFVPDVNGRMKKFDANCLPKIPKPAARDPNSNQVVNPYCDKSEVMIDNVDCFSTEQLRRRIRSLSPAQKKNKVRRSRTLGTIQCEVGSADESAVLEYTVSQDSRTYTLKGNGQDAAGQQITLEFGALRSFLNYVSRDNSVGNMKSSRNIRSAKRH